MTSRSTTPSILIVEDDAVLRGAYETVLAAEGYTVLTAADGEEALEQAQNHPPDVILLDMLMPHMNGLDFLRAYKVSAQQQPAKIIMLSNMSVPSDVKAAIELGAAKYLTKSSFTPKEIETIIKDVLHDK